MTDVAAEFEKTIQDDGIVLFPSIVDETMLERMKKDLDICYAINLKIQKQNGVPSTNVAHHLAKSMWRGGSFADFLEHLPLKEYVSQYFGNKPFIMNAISGIYNFPSDTTNYEHRPHRDMRSYYPVRLSLNMMLMLDDLSAEPRPVVVQLATHLADAAW